jgi:DNA replication and repair protein RecF
VQIRRIHLKNFRCFSDRDLSFDAQRLLISGQNGSGKTSLLEALHYACYLRSFRASSPRDLIAFGHNSFFIKIRFDESQASHFEHELLVGFKDKKRLVKIDKHPVNSYKELTSHYRIITISEDDLDLIKGGPETRRSFIDQALLLDNPDFIHHLRAYKQVLRNRNALLQSYGNDKASYTIWTQQLWQHTKGIQQCRQQKLMALEKRLNSLLSTHFSIPFTMQVDYQSKKDCEESSGEEFLEKHSSLYEQERALGRSLFGAHLDDIAMIFQGKKTKAFASRGQQKMMIVLLKVAQLLEFMEKKGAVTLLLDDFMTDFDNEAGETLLEVLTNLPVQLIFTSPISMSSFGKALLETGAQHHVLTR